ncbi:NINE protein [Polycladidibacter stylochi]|uniref:NINE protein n=1 Tax=Polycladidibacter stylochi TaxID=1807766 RepID=UPI000829F3C2|nr:TM2 domain-containing protein [Pseudovibrio stylochi]
MTTNNSSINLSGWGFCAHCGCKIAFTAKICPQCGVPQLYSSSKKVDNVSPKNYGVAVALCGIFGILGIHHFYLGNLLHGLFDFGLCIAGIMAFISATTEPSMLFVALFLFLLDAIHTVFVFTKLIIGNQKDGKGRIVSAP